MILWGIAGRVDAAPLLPPDFNREVRPILVEHCFACHGQDAQARRGDLRLDVREEALASGAFLPGRAAGWELLGRLQTSGPDEVMPPLDPKPGPVLV